MAENEICWMTGDYTDECDCSVCNHYEECCGAVHSDDYDEDEE